MKEISVLKQIAENLTERKSSAALNNYQVLTNNIIYLNDLCKKILIEYEKIYNLIDVEIKKENNLKCMLIDDSKQDFYLKKLILAIFKNDISILNKFLMETRADKRELVNIDNINRLGRGFNDYNELVTTSRQFVDGLVSDIYQLLVWDAKELNYHILKSLSSFDKYATESLKKSIFNNDVKRVLNDFNSLSNNKKLGKESDFSKCSNKSFRDKVNYIFNMLNLRDNTALNFKDEIINLYGFSSEFTHVGYISTFFTSSIMKNEVLFCDEVGPYLLSSENFNELKYEILNSGMVFLSYIYLPSIVKCLSYVFENNSFVIFKEKIEHLIKEIDDGLETRYQSYYAFIVSDYKTSGKTYPFSCICGYTNTLKPPYRSSDQYCRKCGSSINLIAIESDSGYIVTNKGLARVIGSNAPILSEEEERKKFEEILKQNPINVPSV